MEYVLLLVYAMTPSVDGAPPSDVRVVTQEFDSEKACNVAGNYLEYNIGFKGKPYLIKWECQRKGGA